MEQHFESNPHHKETTGQDLLVINGTWLFLARFSRDAQALNPKPDHFFTVVPKFRVPPLRGQAETFFQSPLWWELRAWGGISRCRGGWARRKESRVEGFQAQYLHLLTSFVISTDSACPTNSFCAISIACWQGSAQLNAPYLSHPLLGAVQQE